ncbi:hypothetical protein DPMN_094036 [Dreissena polymorpha]|uniref:Uncharacterized protein n=1 Tax=Dreissena polymorpha TaxID=45954 RepID=A0A9D4L5C2_DREPO|nr:hypothetical protein DPMN_094036 [Dreissena polymorpha]
MELEGLKRGIAALREKGIQIKEIVTDRHMQIKNWLKDNHRNIKACDMYCAAHDVIRREKPD